VSAADVRIVHRTSGRTRLRTRGRKGDTGYFQQLQAALQVLPGVRAVYVNARTESILVEHDVPGDPLLREAEQRGLLRVEIEAVQEEPYLVRLGHTLIEGDQKLRSATSGRVNLDTLAFAGMLVGGIFQVYRGHALPAGVTMLRYAVEFVTSSVGGLPGEAMARARGGQACTESSADEQA
jgi:Heavy metal associated domain 2